MERANRESGIELLRILAMVGVIVLHYNAGRAFVYCTSAQNYTVLCVLECVCICAVDLFILISGYFLCATQKRNLEKVIELYFQLSIVKLGAYFFNIYAVGEELSVKGMLRQLVPDDYYVVLYIVLYIISPYINMVLNGLETRQRTKLLITLLIIFSVWPTIVDLLGEIRGQSWFGLSTVGAYGSQYGISVVNFVLLYVVGAYIRLNKIYEKVNKKTLPVAGWCVCVAGIFLWSCVNERLTAIGLRSAWVYHNPLVILSAVLLFLIFKNLDIKSKWIIQLAQGSFMCYLVHLHILDKFQIAEYVNRSLLRMFLHIAITAVCLYGISYAVYLIYQLFFGKLFRQIHIPFHIDD